MKKNFKLAFVVLAAICFGQQAKAQATATVNITLTDAMSITLNTSTVDIAYTTAAHYAGEHKKSMPGHFTVVSNKPYDVNVKINGNFSPILDLGELDLTVAVTSAAPAGSTQTPAVLEEVGTNKLLIDAAPASIGALYDVDYIIPRATELLNKTGPFSSTVTYTVSAN